MNTICIILNFNEGRGCLLDMLTLKSPVCSLMNLNNDFFNKVTISPEKFIKRVKKST